MKTLPLSNDGVIETRWHTNDEEVVVESIQDVQPILDANMASQNDEVNPAAIGRHAARIPVTVLREWKKEFERRYKIGYYQAPNEVRQKFLFAKLNDRDYARLRTWQGRL